MKKAIYTLVCGVILCMLSGFISMSIAGDIPDGGKKAEKIKKTLSGTELGKYLNIAGLEFKKAVETNARGWGLYQFIMDTPQSAVQKPILIFYNPETETIALGMVISGGQVVMPKDKTAFNPGLKSTSPEVVANFRKEYREVINPAGSKVLYLFYDPDCPFCKRLEAKLANYKGAFKIIRKWYPLVQIHPDAKKKSIERQKEILQANGVKDAGALARKIVEQDIEDGRKAGITGTPMVVAGNGRILPTIPDLEY